MVLQNAINGKTSNIRLDTIATQSNPASTQNIQLLTDGNINFANASEAGGNDPEKVDESTYIAVTTSRSLLLTDRGQFLGCESSSATVITVPKDSTTNFSIGSFVEISQVGSGSVTIAQEDGSVNIRRYNSLAVTGHLLSGKDAACVLKKVSANEWRLYGGVDTSNIDYGGSFLDTYRTRVILSSEFLGISGTTSFAPFLGTAISSGTLAAANAGIVTRNHPGVVKLRSSTTANSGYLISSSSTSILIGGGEIYECVVNFATLTNITHRFGLHDCTTSADAVDGAYFEILSTGVFAKTSSNSIRTTSTSLFTPATATWYRFKFLVNSAATQVDFYVYNDSGTLLGSTSITTNIPTAAGRETAISIISTNSGTTATDLSHLDYLAFSYATPLIR